MTTSLRRLPAVCGLLSLGLLGVPACNRSETAPAPPSPPAPAAAPAPAVAPTPAAQPAPAAAAQPAPSAAAAPAAQPATAPAPAAQAAPAAAAPAHPDVCEVELAGTVKSDKPVPAGQRLYVFIAQGRDCMAKDAHILASTPVAPETSRFFYEVFPKWGSDLSLCAAAVAAPDQPATLYGKATAKFHAEATGEITYENIVITVKPGPAHTFPAQRQALDPDPPAQPAQKK